MVLPLYLPSALHNIVVDVSYAVKGTDWFNLSVEFAGEIGAQGTGSQQPANQMALVGWNSYVFRL